MPAIELLSAATAGLVGLGAAETWAHRRRLARIPCRIHVSGTRGKSSVTRLLAAGMRNAGRIVAAKTTGTLARMILPSGRELPVFRPAGANIIEQVRIVSAATDIGVDTLVLECMALIPWLHWVCENKLVRATHGVITNARADHLDVMGPGEADVARTLAGMIPVKGTLFTAEQKHLAILQAAAKDRGTRVITIDDSDCQRITDEELAAFRYVEHRENVALALRVLEELEVDRGVALAGMQQAPPDPGALIEWELEFFGRQIVFLNAFAANDPQSTETIWKIATSRHQDVTKTIAVCNLRADRPSRTVQLAQANFWRQADHVVLMGTGAYLFARTAAQLGLDPSNFTYADNRSVAEIFESILGLCRERTLVVGLANIGGQGLRLVDYFRNRSKLANKSS